MERRNTKEVILLVALDLFSERGFDGTSIRDIARAIGIRESALYKHYASKQAIFDALFEGMKQRYEEATDHFHLPKGEFREVALQYGEQGVGMVKHMGKSMFLFLLQDDYASKFRRMLTIEQFKNTRAGDVYHSFFIDNVLTFETGLFGEMMRQGFFKQADPYLTALEFYAPFFLLLTRYDRQADREQEALGLLERHLEHFAEVHLAEPSCDRESKSVPL